MKKVLLTIALVLGIAVTASAQPRAVGLKLGWGAEIEYQHTLGPDFVEVDLGVLSFNTFNVASTYNFMIAKPQWTDRGEWGFYAGPGAALGVGLHHDANFFHLAVAGQIGLEYTFWVPVKLSFDLRPQIGYLFGVNGFYWGIMPSISVAYRF